MPLIIIILVLLMLFGGGGYYGVHSGYCGNGAYGGGLGIVLIIAVCF